MSADRLFLERWTAWAPGLQTDEAVAAWARGEARIRNVPDAPPLAFLPALFRRRLSQLSRMTLEVGHRLAASGPGRPTVFASRYGEINKQYAITAGLLDEGEVSPALFSLSVFNTPVYLLSIAERNTAAASAVYAGEHGLAAAFLDALGFIRAGQAEEGCLVIFADEAPPAAYLPLFAQPPEPYAFGLALSPRPTAGARPLTLERAETGGERPAVHPLALLRWLAAGADAPFAFPAPGTDFTLEAGAPC